jgi:hypothetical protein
MAALKAVDWLGTVTIVGVMVMLLPGLHFRGTAFPWHSVIGLLLGAVCLAGSFAWNEVNLTKYPLMSLGFLLASPVSLRRSHTPYCYNGISYWCHLWPGSSPHRSLSASNLHWDRLQAIVSSLYTRISAISPTSHIIIFEATAGLGTGLLFTSPPLALQAHAKQENTATATSTMGFVKNFSTCLSVVLGGMTFQNGMKSHADLTGEYAAASVMVIRTINNLAMQMAVKQAYAESIRSIWIVSAVVAGCAIFLRA